MLSAIVNINMGLTIYYMNGGKGAHRELEALFSFLGAEYAGEGIKEESSEGGNF